ncbi:hypothetical protein HK100_001643 [Physocladia obscura]|uniref:Uncharacterized protein n=1 Tax=Physocladia obscura TaxID=109957 RepID=A0AAD5T2I4_9FUNG|nr:hypothetical protein HK100_001643 [Physocladia obscura]
MNVDQNKAIYELKQHYEERVATAVAVAEMEKVRRVQAESQVEELRKAIVRMQQTHIVGQIPGGGSLGFGGNLSRTELKSGYHFGGA